MPKHAAATLSAGSQAARRLTATKPAGQLGLMANLELPITGYLDRFSHRPGETFSCVVSVAAGGAYRVRLLRVISGDPNPAGPELQFGDCSDSVEPTLSGRRKRVA